MQVRERLGDALGVEHERTHLILGGLPLAAHQPEAAAARHADDQAAQRTHQRSTGRGEVAADRAVEPGASEHRRRAAAQQSARVAQDHAHQIAHGHQ